MAAIAPQESELPEPDVLGCAKAVSGIHKCRCAMEDSCVGDNEAWVSGLLVHWPGPFGVLDSQIAFEQYSSCHDGPGTPPSWSAVEGYCPPQPSVMDLQRQKTFQILSVIVICVSKIYALIKKTEKPH